MHIEADGQGAKQVGLGQSNASESSNELVGHCRLARKQPDLL